MANELLLQRIDNLCKEHNISKRTLASIVGISWMKKAERLLRKPTRFGKQFSVNRLSLAALQLMKNTSLT